MRMQLQTVWCLLAQDLQTPVCCLLLSLCRVKRPFTDIKGTLTNDLLLMWKYDNCKLKNELCEECLIFKYPDIFSLSSWILAGLNFLNFILSFELQCNILVSLMSRSILPSAGLVGPLGWGNPSLDSSLHSGCVLRVIFCFLRQE